MAPAGFELPATGLTFSCLQSALLSMMISLSCRTFLSQIRVRYFQVPEPNSALALALKVFKYFYLVLGKSLNCLILGQNKKERKMCPASTTASLLKLFLQQLFFAQKLESEPIQKIWLWLLVTAYNKSNSHCSNVRAVIQITTLN